MINTVRWLTAARAAILVGGLVALTPPSSAAGQDLVARGATWKFKDDGSDQGTAWREVDFNDSAWTQGPAQLGYGDGDEKTVVSFGSDKNNKFVTTYFRHTF